jgi:anthranilate synthase component I
MDRPRPLPAGLDLLALHRLAPARYPLLLESVAGGNALSRWDLLFIASGEGIELGADGLTRGLDGVAMEGGFLRALDGAWRAAPAGAGPADLPFRGGWALYLSYELAGEVEPVLALPPPPTPLPIALALRCPGVIARDRESGECVAWAEPAHATLLHALEADIAGIGQLPALPAWQAPAGIEEDPPQRFLDGVARVHEYLRAGDVFQVNLSRAWRARFDTPPDPAAWYARLREANPAPFAGLLARPGWAMASSSPERLVSVRGDVAQTRPIAGTRPRVAGDDEAARIRELVGHPKERAEHVMLIDLERNDLGRVCQPGSVEVDELMVVESYTHVHHIVSNVRGRLR